MPPDGPVKMLFVCVGNTCRSQMAEAFARHLAQGKAEVWSAGVWPYGSIVPETQEAMADRGMPLDGQLSKGLWNVPLAEMDIVVRMGREVRFALPEGFKGRLVDWRIPDPYTHDQSFFYQVRDLIEAKVAALVEEECGVGTVPCQPGPG